MICVVMIDEFFWSCIIKLNIDCLVIKKKHIITSKQTINFKPVLVHQVQTQDKGTLGNKELLCFQLRKVNKKISF